MKLLSRAGFVNFREFFWSSFFLGSSLLLAVFSSIARREGQFYAAAFLAVLALVLALLVGLALVPRLLARARVDLGGQLRHFRVTRRGAFFLVVVGIIGFSTFNTGNNLLVLVLSFLLASLVVSGLVSNLVLKGLKVSLSIPESLHAGQKATFFLSLHNLKRVFPSIALRLRGIRGGEAQEKTTDFFLQERNFPYVRAGQRLSLPLSSEFRRRGIYPLNGFEVATTFPFGFFLRGRTLDARGNIVVFPRLADPTPLLRRYPQLQGGIEGERRGGGAGLHTIRDYQTGDSSKHVHWKATARNRRLMVKEFSIEEDRPLSILFSTYVPAHDGKAADCFEQAVSLVAGLVHQQHLHGKSLHFDSGEFQVQVNGRREDYEKLMEYLSQVRPAERPKLEQVRPHGPAILFTAGDSVRLSGVPRIDYLSLSKTVSSSGAVP